MALKSELLSWRRRDECTTEQISLMRLLEEHGIKRLPVTSEGSLIGMISRSDILRVVDITTPHRVAAGDEAIRTSIATKLHEIFGGSQCAIVRKASSPQKSEAAQVIAETFKTSVSQRLFCPSHLKRNSRVRYAC